MPTDIYNPDFAGSADIYAISVSADATVADASEVTSLAAGYFRVSDSAWHLAGLPAGVFSIIFREGDSGSPLPTDVVAGRCDGFGFDGTNEVFPDTVDVATLTAQVTAMLGQLQSGLPVKNDPSRTWIMRRGKDIVGSDQELTKHAADAPPFFADVRLLLGDNEHVQSVTSVVAEAGIAISGTGVLGDVIYFIVSGGTAANAYQITVSFTTTKNAPLVCTGTVGVI